MSAHHRIQTPDLLKGLAVILMIQVHLMELFAFQHIYDGPVGKGALFLGGVPAAPVFMIIMGYFLAYRNKAPAIMMVRGMKLFVAGILLNIGLNAHLIYNVIFKGWGATVNIWHYIFGVDILHLAGLSLMVLAFLSRIFKNNPVPYLLLLIPVVTITYVIPFYSGNHGFPDYIMAYIYSSSEWSYFPLIPWLAYPLAGYAFFLIEKNYLRNRINLKIKVIAILTILIFIALTFDYATTITHQLTIYYHHDALFFLWSIGFITGWSLLVSFAGHLWGSNFIFRYVKWLGIHVTTVYIIQWLIIGNVATAIFKSLPLSAVLFWFVLILIFTSIFTWLWNNFKSVYHIKFLKL